MTVKIKKNWPGGPGPGSILRVDRVFPDQFPSGFLPSPGMVPGSGRPGPRSTRRAGSGFKTLLISHHQVRIGFQDKILAICTNPK